MIIVASVWPIQACRVFMGMVSDDIFLITRDIIHAEYVDISAFILLLHSAWDVSFWSGEETSPSVTPHEE